MIACTYVYMCLLEYISVGMLWICVQHIQKYCCSRDGVYIFIHVCTSHDWWSVCVNQFAGLDELQTQEYRRMEHRKCAVGLHWWNI